MTHSTLAHTSAKAQNAVSTQVAALNSKSPTLAHAAAVRTFTKDFAMKAKNTLVAIKSLISHAFWAVKGLNLLKIHAFSAFQALKMPTTQMKRARNFSLSLSLSLSRCWHFSTRG